MPWTDAVLRKVALASRGAKDENCSPLPGSVGRDSSSLSRQLFDSIPAETLAKRRTTLVIDLDSVVVDILAAYHADMAGCPRLQGRHRQQHEHTDDYNAAATASSAESTASWVGNMGAFPPTIRARVAAFFAFVEERLHAPKLISVRFVMGRFSRFQPLSLLLSETETAATAAGVCRAAGFWGTACPPGSDMSPPTNHHHAEDGFGVDAEGLASASLPDDVLWYLVYRHACETVEASKETCSLHLTNEAGIFGAVQILRQLTHGAQAQWLASSQKSKSEVPNPRGIPAVCLCSSNSAALFVTSPMDSVVVDIYQWSRAPTGQRPGELRATHAAATAAALGLRRATLLPALFSVLAAAAASPVPAAVAAVGAAAADDGGPMAAPSAEADVLLEKAVSLVNRHGPFIGECLCEELLPFLPRASGVPSCAADGAAAGDGAAPSTELVNALQTCASRFQLLLNGTSPAVITVLASKIDLRACASVPARWLGVALSPHVLSGASLSRQLVPPLLSEALLPSRAGLRVRPSPVVTGCCPTRSAMLRLGTAFTQAALKEDDFATSCACGLCSLTTTTTCPAGGKEGEAAAPSRSQDAFPPGTPASLLHVLWVARRGVHDEPWPVFPSAAVLDEASKLPVSARLSVTALLLLRQARLLATPTRAIVWLFHLLRVLAAAESPVAADSIDTALTDAVAAADKGGSGATADIPWVFAVTWGELMAVQDALALVTCATAWCGWPAATSGHGPVGLVVGADVKTALCRYGFLRPLSASASSDRQQPVTEGGAVEAVTLDPLSLDGLAPEELTSRAVEDVFALLKSETDTWVRCKTFMTLYESRFT